MRDPFRKNLVGHSVSNESSYSGTFVLSPITHHSSLITGPMDLPILFFKTILFRPYVFVFLAAYLFAVI